MASSAVKTVFVDIRDTLGYVDSPGHLVLFKPSTLQFLQALKKEMGLRIGVITNLPANVNHEAGVNMLKEAGILNFVDQNDVVSSHEAGAEKPLAAIYKFACEKLKVDPSEAMFIGENLLEVIGAQAAGLNAMIKPFPPARDFLFRPLTASASSKTDSGRLSESMMEEEHLVGKRIVGASAKMAAMIGEGKNVPLQALGNLVYLLQNFVDPFHHRKEEKILLPFAISRGYPKAKTAWILLEHDQGRNYFNAIEIAYNRLLNGDEIAKADLKLCLEGFVALYKQHGAREDNEFLVEVGALFSDQDDALIVDLFAKAGPGDLTPYLALMPSWNLNYQNKTNAMWILPGTDNRFLNQTQRAQVTVLYNAYQPGDDVRNVPNAEQAGAIEFIDLLLARDNIVFEDMPQWKNLYPPALEELNKQANDLFGKPLEFISPEEASSLISKLETGSLQNFSPALKQAEIFDTFRRHCIQGCFCDPRWGGNKEGIMWKWYGYQEETKELQD